MWFPGCSDVASGSGQKKMKHIWNKGIIVQAAGEGFNPSYLGWRFLLWFSSEWESRFYKLPVSAEELELHRWFPHEKWRFIKLSYSPKKKKKKSSLKTLSSSLLSCCWESSWKFPDVIINLFAYEAFLPELPHSKETKEEGENFCNEISPKTWQQ